MKAIFSIAILLVVITFPGCETHLKGLPDKTTNGKNTVGCIVNGKTIYNELTLNIEALWDTIPNHRLSIRARFNDQSELFVSLYNSGTYAFQRVFDVNNTSDSVEYISATSCSYRVSPNPVNTGNTFTLTATKFDSNIVSGTFSMTARTEGCVDLVITEGRFDSTIGSKEIGPF